MADNREPKGGPRFFERKVLVIVLIVIVVASASYFLLHAIDMQSASDEPHGGPDPAYEAEDVIPPATQPTQ